MEILPRSFYAQATTQVAESLLGQELRFRDVAGIIIECEAYLGADDLAAHASRGITKRTKVIYGPPGFAYVYLNYGLHHCLNLVCEPDGIPGCVLIRGLWPTEGLDEMRLRRRRNEVHELCPGPGKLTQALGLDLSQNGWDVTSGELVVVRKPPVSRVEIQIGPRIGITKCADWPLRFWIEPPKVEGRA
jgi:DNA-3-methyladenine glycosylase